MNRHDLIIRPVVTEKWTRLRGAFRQYCFVAQWQANRSEIKKAVEETLKVKVEKVRIVHVRGKRKGSRQFIGKRPDVKRAMVTLKKGETIPLFEG